MLEKDVVIRISFDQTNNGGEPPADTLLVPHTEANYQLMADHGLTAADLPELGDAAQVAATLSGTVALTPTQIRRLAQRFHVAPVTFL